MTEATTASTGDSSESEKFSRAVRTLKRYLGEEKQSLTVERAHERLREETVDLSADELDTVIESSAVTTSTTPSGETQITAADVYDTSNQRRSNPFAEQVDGMTGEYGGISTTFEVASEADPSVEAMPETTADVTADDFTALSEVGSARADALHDGGFVRYADIQSASVEELTTAGGVKEKVAREIRASAEKRCDPVAQIAASAFERGRSRDDDSLAARVLLANEVDIPAGEPIADTVQELKDDPDLRFHGLPILEKTENPFIEEVAELEPFKMRTLKTGDTAVEGVANMLGQHEAVGLRGYPAVGKDTLIEYICAKTNRPVLRIPADGTMLSQELFGVRTTDGSGETVWENGPVPKAVEYGWTLVIDEINALDPDVAIALNRLLENDGFLYLKDRNKVIEPHPRFQFLATMNPAEADFGGTKELNQAFKSRIAWLDIPYLGAQQEAELVDSKLNGQHRVFTQEQVLELVEMAGQFRDAVDDNRGLPRLSTRHLLKAGNLARGASNKTGAIKEIVEGACGPRDRTESALQLVDDLDKFD